jgi:hypothetical protein
VIDLLPTSGRRGVGGCRFVTYSVLGQRTTTYLALVAKGLRPVGIIRGKPPKGAHGDVALGEVDRPWLFSDESVTYEDMATVEVDDEGNTVQSYKVTMRAVESASVPAALEPTAAFVDPTLGAIVEPEVQISILLREESPWHPPVCSR